MIPYICKYCNQSTLEVDCDYLTDYDHLACALKAESKDNNFDHCIMCDVETTYLKSTHIDMRIGYIEGAGQLCSKCYNKGNEPRLLTLPEGLVLSNPNDQELGYKVRQLYYKMQE